MTKATKVSRKRAVLSIKAPDADAAFLAGDFNGWDPKKMPMKKNASGVWTRTVMLAPGTYQYKFQVDGRWQLDTENDNQCVNCYGTHNNIITV